MPTKQMLLRTFSFIICCAGCPQQAVVPPHFDGPPRGPNIQFVSDNPLFGVSFAGGDLDADGTIDIAVAEGGVTWVFASPSNGTWTSQDAAAELFGDNVSASDLDGDGTLELFTSSAVEDTFDPVIHVHGLPLSADVGTGGSRANVTLSNTNLAPPRVAVADLDDSPGEELVIGAAGYDGFGPDEGSKLILFSAQDIAGEVSVDDALAVIDASLTADSYYDLEVGDATGDGRSDLLVSFVGFNHSDESYLLEAPLAAQGDIEQSSDVTFGNNRARFVGDIDGDGRTDIGMPAYESVQFWTGALAGPDPGPATLALESFDVPSRLEVYPAGDIDGDGEQDVLIIDPPALLTELFYGPLSAIDEADLRFRLPEEDVLGFVQGQVLPDFDGNGTSELLLGEAGDLNGYRRGFVWVVGLPF